MSDWHLSATAVAATVLWVIGVALAMVQLLTDVGVGQLGIIAAAGGATLNVRGYFVKLEDRERNAFNLGRDYENARMHSVQ